MLTAAPQIRSMVPRFLRDNQESLDVTIQEFDLLRFAEGNEVRMVDLANRMSVTPPAVTKIVDGLARRRLVARRQDRNDRRVTRLSLTASGQTRLDSVRDAASEFLSGLITELDDDQRRQLDGGLSALISAVERLNSPPER